MDGTRRVLGVGGDGVHAGRERVSFKQYGPRLSMAAKTKEYSLSDLVNMHG